MRSPLRSEKCTAWAWRLPSWLAAATFSAGWRSRRATWTASHAILKATKVEGIYDADPNLVKDATMFDKITYLEFLKRGLKVMDSTAISLCRDNSLPIVIFNLNKSGNIRRVVTGEKVGSLVMA